MEESFYRGYRYLRKPAQMIALWSRSEALLKFFVKVDHWIRIRPNLKGVIAKRNGIKFSLDLPQLIDNQVFFESVYEPKTSKAFQQLVKPGMRILDIGANVGIHTLSLARLAGQHGQVIALEPTEWAFRKLKANLSLNLEISKIVEARQLALSDQSEGLKRYEFRAQWRKAGGYTEGEVGSAEFITLDDFMQVEQVGGVDFIKLDVDGFETKILRGARSTLTTYRPVLLVEMSDFFQKRAGGSAQEMIGILLECGYAFYYEDLEKLNDGLGNVIAKLKDWETINIVCMPTGKI